MFSNFFVSFSLALLLYAHLPYSQKNATLALIIWRKKTKHSHLHLTSSYILLLTCCCSHPEAIWSMCVQMFHFFLSVDGASGYSTAFMVSPTPQHRNHLLPTTQIVSTSKNLVFLILSPDPPLALLHCGWSTGHKAAAEPREWMKKAQSHASIMTWNH